MNYTNKVDNFTLFKQFPTHILILTVNFRQFNQKIFMNKITEPAYNVFKNQEVQRLFIFRQRFQPQFRQKKKKSDN